MTDDDPIRSIELEVEVPGTPEQVWQAIATGPGITSWYVPHQVEQREGGAANASFGPGPEMQAPGRVAAWDPPRRIVFDGGEGVGGLAFEWLVEARDGGSCVVRLVNSGFGEGGEWDDQYDAMTDGWRLFMANLVLHLEHFAGQEATALLPMAQWPVARPEAWVTLTTALDIPAEPQVGQRLEITGAGGRALAGTCVESVPGHHLLLLLDEPAPGTAFVAVEGPAAEPGLMVSVWSYLYGPDRDALAAELEPAWTTWLTEHAPEPDAEA